jgi:hypothetical protein
MISFCGVIEHHIQYYLNPSEVKILYHFLEFYDLLSERSGCRIRAVRSKETNCIVAPIVC